MGRRAFTEEERERGRALVEVLARERAGHGLTQEGLAAESEVAVDTIRKLEKCATYNPGFFTVTGIASALEIGLDDLLVLHERQMKTRRSARNSAKGQRQRRRRATG